MAEDSLTPQGAEIQAKKSQFFYGYVIVACSFLILMVSFGVNYSFGIFFNPLLTDLGWSRAVTSTGYSIASFVGGLVGVITGRLCDTFGPKTVVLGAGIFLALGCLLMSQVREVWQLYLFYGLLVGTGYGGAAIAISSSISRWFIRYRGLMTGIVVAGIGCGTVVMPLIANRLLETFDWRESFALIGVIALVVIIPAAFFLKRDPSKIGQLAYGATEPTEAKAVVKDSGMTWRQAMRTGRFWLYCSICFLFGYYVQSVMVHIVPHAKALQIGSGTALIMSLLGVGSIVGRIVMGTVSDRIGVKYTLIIALSVMVAAFGWLQVAGSLWMLYVFGLVYGFAYGALIAMQTLAPAKMFGLLSLGTLVGVVTFVYTTGGAIGPIITGFIYDRTSSYHLAFLICAVLAGVTLVLALILRPAQRKGN